MKISINRVVAMGVLQEYLNTIYKVSARLLEMEEWDFEKAQELIEGYITEDAEAVKVLDLNKKDLLTLATAYADIIATHREDVAVFEGVSQPDINNMLDVFHNELDIIKSKLMLDK